MNPWNAATFNPFPGLRPFQMDEEYLFFGRDEQRRELLDLLREHRFVAVLGSSGGGKSSLVRAGLMPALHGGYLAGAGSHWSFALMRPGGNPIGALAHALRDSGLWEDQPEPEILALETDLSRSGLGLIELVRHARLPAGHNLLVVVDQFEELFRFQQNQSERSTRNEAAAFVSLLIEATRQTEVPIFVVLTMRSDFFGDCAQFEDLAEAVNQGEYLVPRMNREQRRQAIEGPIRVGGGKIAPRLVQQLLQDVGDDPDQLPILQHALMRTWDFWRHQTGGQGELDLEHYEGIGGMREALSRHADEVHLQLPDDKHRRVAERLLKCLTERGKDGRGIRRPTRFESLCGACGASPEIVGTVVDAFRAPGCTFLMPGPSVPLERGTVVDIAHESLMRVWKRLATWVDEESESARIYRRLSDSALLWKQAKASIYRDPDLQLALDWKEETQPNAQWASLYGGRFEESMEFLEASRLAQEAEREAVEKARQHELDQAKALAEAQRERAEQQVRASRRLGWFVRGLAVLVCLAAYLAFSAAVARRDAQRNEALARTSANQALTNAQKLRVTMGKTDLTTASDFLEKGMTDRALNHFARALRFDSNQWAAAFRMVDTLSQRTYTDTPVWQSDGRRIIDRILHSASQDLTVCLDEEGTAVGVDATNGNERWKVSGLGTNFLHSFTRDESHVAFHQIEGTCVVVDMQSGRQWTVPIGTNVVDLSLSGGMRQAQYLAVLQNQTNEWSTTIWNVFTGQRVGATLPTAMNRSYWGFIPGRDAFLLGGETSASIYNVSTNLELRAAFNLVTQGESLIISERSQRICGFSRRDETCHFYDWENKGHSSAPIQLPRGVFYPRVIPGTDWMFCLGSTAKADPNQQGKDFALHVIDMTTGARLSQVEEQGIDRVWVVLNMKMVVFRTTSRTIRVHDTLSGRLISEFPEPGISAAQQLDMTSHGILVFITKERELYAWDVYANREPYRPIKLPYPVNFYALSKDFDRIAVSTETGKWLVYSLLDGSQICESIPTDAAGIPRGFSRNGERLITLVKSGTVKLKAESGSVEPLVQKAYLCGWDIRSRALMNSVFPVAESSWWTELSADSKRLHLITPTSPIRRYGMIYEMGTGKLLASDTVPQGLSMFWDQRIGAAYSRDSRKFAFNGGPAGTEIRESNNGKRIAVLTSCTNAYHLNFSPDSTRLLVLQGESKKYWISLWNAETGSNVCETPSFGALISSGIFSPDGRRIYGTVVDGSVLAADALTGKLLWEHKGASNFLVWLTCSADGHHLGAAAIGGNSLVLNAATGEVELNVPTELGAHRVEFSQDSSRVAWSRTRGRFIEAELWDRVSGTLLGSGGRNSQGFSFMKFGWEGNALLASSKQRVVAINGHDGSELKEFYDLKAAFNSLYEPVASTLVCVDTDRIFMGWVPPHGSQIPSWLPRFSDWITRRRLDEDGRLGEVDNVSLESLRADLGSAATGNPYHSWAEWWLDGSPRRGIFPGTGITVSDRIQRMMDNDPARADLQQIVKLQPTNGLAWLKLARFSMEDFLRKRASGGALELGDPAFIRCAMATNYAPSLPEAWLVSARVLGEFGQLKEALANVDRALQLEPASFDGQLLRAWVLHRLGWHSEAGKAWGNVWMTLTNSAIRSAGKTLANGPLFDFREFAREVRRPEDAYRFNALLYSTPVRDSGLTAEVMDLGGYNNTSLQAGFMGDPAWNFKQLKPGEVIFKGIRFDIRGILRVGNVTAGAMEYPNWSRIPIDAKATSLHLLHAAETKWADNEKPEGIGRVIYDDGRVEEFSISTKSNICEAMTETKDSGYGSIWSGDFIDANGIRLVPQLFAYEWKNPYPDRAIKSLEISAVPFARLSLFALSYRSQRLDIVDPPKSQIASAGASVEFSASVSNSVPVALQWLFEGRPLLNETNRTLKIPQATPDQVGEYQLAVQTLERGTLGRILSSPGSLAISNSFRLMGGLRREIFMGVNDVNLDAFLKRSTNLQPSRVDWVPTLESPEMNVEDCVVRLSGHLTPETDGDFVFHICGDDEFRLELSSTESPSQLRRIASGKVWTILRGWQFDRSRAEPSSISEPVHLVGGKRYAVSVLLYNRKVYGHVSVLMRRNGASVDAGDLKPVSGRFLSTDLFEFRN